jgi:hypothetical protein
MSEPAKLKKLSANGPFFAAVAGAASQPLAIRGLHLTAGAAAAASCDIQESGVTVCSLACAAGQSDWFAVDGPFVITDPSLANLTGAGASLTFAY